MNIQELEDKHKEVIGESDLNFPDWLIPGEDTNTLYKKEEELVAKEATKLSVEFAISLLKELRVCVCEMDCDPIDVKIDELKQYLDENKI